MNYAHARTRTGEYRHWLHVFTVREPTDPTYSPVADHYSYPWVFDKEIKPDISHINAIRTIAGSFDHLPSPWRKFSSELHDLRLRHLDVNGKTFYGPYWFVLPSVSPDAVCEKLRDAKRKLRTELSRFLLLDSYIPLPIVQQEFTNAFLAWLEPYRVLTREQEKKDEDSRFSESGTHSV